MARQQLWYDMFSDEGMAVRGMTWDHPRGIDPLVAASVLWEAESGVSIAWDRRSLQDFESFSVEELARQYDLIVIDHPHVGQVADAGCLVALDETLHAEILAPIAAGSVGGSYESYCWHGHQWALPIDAAAQVQAWAPHRIAAPVLQCDALPAMLADGTAMIPLRAPHSLMTFFSLCGLAGVVLDVDAGDLFPADAVPVYDRLATMASAVDPVAWSMDPIAVFEAMARPASRIAVAPFIYGYVSYARDGFREKAIRFADLPLIGAEPRGSALGGTGIAVSAFGADPAGAARFAAWVASGTIQRELIGPSGGQPAHGEAWGDEVVNRDANLFYRATRRTLDLAWLRPRHDGYMAFQQAASDLLEQALRSGRSGGEAIAALNHLYRNKR
jgi:multiple sugar transport system substrate-binding protein